MNEKEPRGSISGQEVNQLAAIRR